MKLNIGYFADGPWSHIAFKRLIKDQDILISFICVRWDTKDNTLENYCKEYGIKYLKSQDVNSEKFIEIIKLFNCDLFVSMSFNQIFKTQLINLPRLKIINCHAGKLPFYRGRNILNWALINDEKDFGITVHFVDEGIDTGDIIIQRCYPISDKDNYSTLLNKAFIECSKVLYEAISMLKSNKVRSFSQNSIDPFGSYCPVRKHGDEYIDWQQTSRSIFNFVRALSYPGPIATTFLSGLEIKIHQVEIIGNASNNIGKPGVVLEIKNQNLIIKTLDSFIKVSEFESGQNIKVGDQFETK